MLSSIERRIKEKIEAVGVPLKDWDIKINRGILTGCNEAFIIDGPVKDRLIAEDPRSAEIIRPILRGRDIKRYSYTFADKWIIATFPSRNYDIDEYPAIKNWLASAEWSKDVPNGYGQFKLEQTGETHIINGNKIKARKKTGNKWFETQDQIGYWDDFSKQKIVWGEISDKTKFCIDLSGEYVPEATTFLMTGCDLQYLLGFLNSSLSEYFFSTTGTTTGMGTVRWKKYKIEQLPVPTASDMLYKELTNAVVDATLQHDDLSRKSVESRVNSIVARIVGLSCEENKYIQDHTKS